MALDGAFLRHIKTEIEESVLQAKVDKVYQPSKEEIILVLRTRSGSFKLLLSARANSPRVHFTQWAPENPMTPPMLCMLLRKRLTSARFAAVRQPELERMLCLDFDTINELGDEVRLTLIIEIMGRHSNVILVDETGTIIEALKRVDAEMSSERLILPGLPYNQPPAQNKLSMLSCTAEEAAEQIVSASKDEELSKAILNTLQGVSPVVCREIAHLTGRGAELRSKSITPEQRERLVFFLNRTIETVRSASGKPCMVTEKTGKPLEFSFLDITQYGRAAVTKSADSFSQLLDEFYFERDRLERMRTRSQGLLKILSNASERLSRKINAQRAELEQCAQREQLRVSGDLVNANLYKIEKGMPFVELENFYDQTLPMMKIKLDPSLTPVQNAQKYYKEYRKAHTAERILAEQIEQAQAELVYIDTVFDALSRADTESELSEIKQELSEQGYIRTERGKKKPPAPLGPLAWRSSDGFTILVGRNNRQNDRLTLKQANNNDIWFHTKEIPGSHTIIVTENKEVPETTLLEAAQLAALHSRAKDSAQVPVDYTQVRNVSKPQGAKPGMVIYVNYRTLYVTPDKTITSRLEKQTVKER